MLCEHLINASSCLAFPGGIPEEILSGKKSHFESLPDDNGFQFKSIGINKNEDDSTKENARGMIKRGVPLEEDMQDKGNEVLGSIVYDVINVLKSEGFFELEEKNEKA
jgi:hypothetical protein